MPAPGLPARLWTLLTREGPRGLVARMRHPKQRDRMRPPVMTLATPLHLVAPPGEGSDIARALAALPVALAPVPARAALPADPAQPDPAQLNLAPTGTMLHLAPGPAGPAFTARDVIILRDPAQTAHLLAAPRPHPRGLAACAAVLAGSPGCLQRLADAGVPGARRFLLPPPAAGETALTGGLARWLIAAGLIPPEGADPSWFPVLANLTPGARLCLSLPESQDRRSRFATLGLDDFAFFDGLRLDPGWHGAGHSHALIARAALRQGAAPLTVCEDDLSLSPDFPARRAAVEAYLATVPWDVFSGLLTNVAPDARIRRVDRQGGVTFVHLDTTIGMVFNIYGPRALQHLAVWPGDGGLQGVGPETGTIDLWLGAMPGLQVVTTLPFLVGHDSGLTSTVFGFSNRRYDQMIRASEGRLARLVARFEAQFEARFKAGTQGSPPTP
jgi:hypothetical protein